MAAIPVQKPGRTGLGVAMAPAAAGDTLPNDGHTVLRVANASGGPVTVTVVQARPCSAGASSPAHDAVAVVPAGQTREISNLPREIFGSAPAVNYSATAGVTVAAVSGS